MKMEKVTNLRELSLGQYLRLFGLLILMANVFFNRSNDYVFLVGAIIALVGIGLIWKKGNNETRKNLLSVLIQAIVFGLIVFAWLMYKFVLK